MRSWLDLMTLEIFSNLNDSMIQPKATSSSAIMYFIFGKEGTSDYK